MDANSPAFVHNRALQGMIAWLAVVWILAAIEPFNRFDWLLENILVFLLKHIGINTV